MKITIEISDSLLEEARKLAARERTTVHAFVEQTAWFHPHDKNDATALGNRINNQRRKNTFSLMMSLNQLRVWRSIIKLSDCR